MQLGYHFQINNWKHRQSHARMLDDIGTHGSGDGQFLWFAGLVPQALHPHEGTGTLLGCCRGR